MQSLRKNFILTNTLRRGNIATHSPHNKSKRIYFYIIIIVHRHIIKYVVLLQAPYRDRTCPVPHRTPDQDLVPEQVHTVKKRLAIFPSTAGMSLTKLSQAGKIIIIPGQGEFGK